VIKRVNEVAINKRWEMCYEKISVTAYNILKLVYSLVADRSCKQKTKPPNGAVELGKRKKEDLMPYKKIH